MNKYLRILVIGIIGIFIFLWCIKGMCLSWVEVNDDYAQITVNFLVPMDKEKIKENIYIESTFESASNFDYTYEWLNDYVVCLKIKEKGEITGQKVKLHIQKATSQYAFIHKTAHIPIQFKTALKLVNPSKEVLIASHEGFEIQFNTPVSLKVLHQYIVSEIPFLITPISSQTVKGEEAISFTKFLLTPHEVLENGKNYVIVLKKGMPSRSGGFLKNAVYIPLKTDVKPQIISTYPKNGDKWIGLYPRIVIATNKPITEALMTIGGKVFKGKLIDSQHILFALNGLLKPETTYTAEFQVIAQSGEKSSVEIIQFTSTTIEKERMWVDVKVGSPSIVKIYKGTNLVRQMNCSVGKEKFEPPIGTYYLQGKGEVYEDNQHGEGANYWLPISENCAFQGVIRNDNWQIKNCAANEIGARTERNNLILEELDAKWMYENIPVEAMIIVRK